jgi:ABC-type uncharacterized transport system ATPase subunit
VVDPRVETNRSLAEWMLGAAVSLTVTPGNLDGRPARAPATAVAPAAAAGERPAGHGVTAAAGPALEVRRLSLVRREPFGTTLADIELTVHAGELLGIAGISGSGQRELLDALSGEDVRAAPGAIRLWGRDVSRFSVRRRRSLGVCSVPEERIGRGSVPTLSLAANTLLTRRDAVTGAGFLRWGVARRLAMRLIQRFGVRARGPDDLAKNLSGGNLQKFIVGRAIDAGPRVLLVAQPTWGLDVGAAAQIRGHLIALAAAGAAVLVVSEDLEELCEICAEIVVMAGGRLSPRVLVGETSRAQIGEWMSGLFPDTGEAATARAEPRPTSNALVGDIVVDVADGVADVAEADVHAR